MFSATSHTSVTVPVWSVMCPCTECHMSLCGVSLSLFGVSLSLCGVSLSLCGVSCVPARSVTCPCAECHLSLCGVSLSLCGVSLPLYGVSPVPVRSQISAVHAGPSYCFGVIFTNQPSSPFLPISPPKPYKRFPFTAFVPHTPPLSTSLT